MHLSLKDMVVAFEIEKKVKASGYGLLDKVIKLLQLPLDSCFLFYNKQELILQRKLSLL